MNGYFYDLANGFAERRILASLRHRLLSPLRGTIVDVGAGTGANFPHFDPGARVIALEPDPSMAQRAETRVTSANASIELRIADDRGLGAFPPESVDAVVMTLVLCTVSEPTSTLQRAKQALKRNGTLVILEHVRSRGAVGAFQDFIAPAWRCIAGGCHLNRDTTSTVAAIGFDTAALATMRLSRLLPIQEIVYGRLSPRRSL